MFSKKLVKIRANKIIAGYVQRQRVMVDLSGYVRPRYIVCGVHQGTFINDVPYQGRQGGPRQPQKQDVIEQEKVDRQVGRSKMAKKRGTSLMDVPQVFIQDPDLFEIEKILLCQSRIHILFELEKFCIELKLHFILQ